MGGIVAGEGAFNSKARRLEGFEGLMGRVEVVWQT